MKKAILIVLPLIIVLSTTTGFIFSRIKQTPQMRVNAKDLPKQGLIIIKPSDPAFNDLAAEFLQSVPDEEMASLKPFSVLVKNTGTKTVVAYTIVWEGTEASGKKQAYVITHANSEALTDSEEYFKAISRTNFDKTIKPGAARLLSLLPLPANTSGAGGGGFGRQQNEPTPLEQSPPALGEANRAETVQRYASQLLAQYVELTVSIDGVFFEDGTFAGTDTKGFFDRMKAQVEAKHDLRKSISEQLKLGKSKDEIFEDLKAKANVKGTASNLLRDSTPADYYNFFSKFFAAQFLQLRALHDDDYVLNQASGSENKPELILRKIK